MDPPTIAKADTDQSPILSIALSGARSQRELSEIADKIVKTHIERAAGVGQVEIIGQLERAISVWVDADRLAAYQIPITAVRAATDKGRSLEAGFLERGHLAAYVDAEHTTSESWTQDMLQGVAHHPLFLAKRPKTYEETIDAVDEILDGLKEARRFLRQNALLRSF
jgi:multidrug efflux pump subunit AcrB